MSLILSLGNKKDNITKKYHNGKIPSGVGYVHEGRNIEQRFASMMSYSRD
jgi:hypothetical protein